jgi:predicted exporter
MSVLGQRRLLGLSVIGTAVLLGAAWLAHVDYSQKISTDVLDLLPAGERSPEVNLVRALASESEARVMLFVLTGSNGAPASTEAAHRFASELASHPQFQEALVLDDSSSRDAIGRTLFEKRLTLLFPHWLAERQAEFSASGSPSDQFSPWLAKDTVARLSRFLSSPEAIAYQDGLPSDPLLLMPGAFGQMRGGLALVSPEVDAKAPTPARVWARITAPPLSAEGQEPVFAAIEQAETATRADFPGLGVAYTGVNRFAAASRERIRHELEWLNALSVGAVLAVVLIFIRGAYRALNLVPPVLLAVMGAWVCATMAFSRIHILVFVVGSLLTGVAIDYGFYLYMQAPAEPGEDYWAKVRRLRKPLFSSCFTTVAGFALLLFSDLPLVRQLGLFVGAGLLCALAGAIIYFSTLKSTFLSARELPTGRGLAIGTRQTIRRVLVVLWLAALPGLLMVKWKDDIRELEIPSPAMQKEDTRIRALFGGESDPAVYLTQGRTLSEARDSLVRFDEWLGTSAKGSEFANLGAVIPTTAEHADAVRFVRDHPEFPGELRSALAAAGYDAGGFTPFFDAYASSSAKISDSDLEGAVHSLASSLTGPVSLLLHDGRPLAWFVTLASPAPAVAPPASTQTVGVDQLQSLNRIFARYRQSALRLSLTGLAIVGLGVLASYGLKDGVRIFSIPCGVALGFFGLCGWLGVPLNLFHLLGAFLGVCLTHNYSIFTVTSAYLRQPPPVSVRLSALCTAASFGVLALSAIPVVHALGVTVSLMVLAALLAIEFEHFAPISSKR